MKTSCANYISEIGRDRLKDMLYQMLLIRRFEETVERLFMQGKIHGTMHLCIGQEPTAVGACAALTNEDKITSTHRGHGHCIAKGTDVPRMMAELLGKKTGHCKGKGGSMHIADLEKGNLGANGIVAGGLPIACGAALTSLKKQAGFVVVCFFGDGATNEGSFHESLNLASIWNLPVIFFCENNQYGMSGNIKEMTKIEHLSERASSYGIPGEIVDGTDVLQVYEVTAKAVERARNGEGPTLIEAKTYRWKGHSRSDARKYRAREEEQDWMNNKDGIKSFREQLLRDRAVTEQEVIEIEERVKQLLEEATEFAENSPEPSIESLEADVYA
ncbi:thiamine pyrophosphate-dependent dehydrogenase E1 component subunit alpha [Peribacillus glennii]|uniref:Thiamine pyrophosphate-dependent dehydrogenase E1 component subunit alpha n=1 Tax=Peribacillus glennii TaxID=2303991 RepID=A0A372LET3_9BACI|nr:thiamine pyrophosphate-dependent dehydrogenase E1 component subunit alpha [Peribacillus glennii]RFU64815.1 thiamine pyrophosphate-dependent dehydrogenase E1 component subunit alpha [Peribacillus glennii]